jgi:cell division protein FtsI/penicillin-binding protein 2
MAQTIGIVSRDGRGLEGVELRYDAHLRSRDGRRVSIYDARSRRRPIWSRLDRGSRPQDGGDVVLTLDAVVQSFLEDQIAETVTKFEAESGVGVVMSPITGDILAMGQYPTFDPNRYAASPPEARRNRVIGDALEPGSTFKPYVASGALANGFVSPGERIFCHLGQHYFGGRLIHDSSPRGELTFEEILSKSSNIGMAIIGQRMGNQTIHRTVRSFGFGSPTGVDLPGEASGLVAPLARWTSYSTTSVPFGQEIAVTAIQLATGLCAIVNGGTLLKPRVTKALLGPDGELLESFDGPQVIRRVMPPDVADYMAQKVLLGVVKNGGGKTAALSDWQVLGKTGTAQIAYADRPGYEPEAYMSSFIGAAPAENPQVVVVVMIRKPNPKLGYYGSKVAAPAVGRILEKTLSYLGVPPSPRMGNDQEVFRDTATRLVKIAEVHPG